MYQYQYILLTPNIDDEIYGSYTFQIIYINNNYLFKVCDITYFKRKKILLCTYSLTSCNILYTFFSAIFTRNTITAKALKDCFKFWEEQLYYGQN